MIWIYIFLASLTAWYVRPILPIDETRYLSVAYEMFIDKEWVVPKLNGEIYSQKPPLLFWLIQSGWSIFGVNIWWPRILGLIALLMNGYVIKKISNILFPNKSHISKTSFLIYTTSFFPLIFSTLVFFDLWLSLWVSCAWLFILKRGNNQKKVINLIAFGFFLALSFLTKGPVALIFILPPLCFRKLYSAEPLCFWVIQGTAIAILLSLVWFIPASISASETFNINLLWEQIVNRISSAQNEVDGATTHSRPFWYFLVLLPLLFLPWTFCSKMWSRKHHPFLLSITIPTIIIFSSISGKQPHYLLPLFPFFALALSSRINNWRTLNSNAPRLTLVAFSTALIVFSVYADPPPSFLDKSWVISSAAATILIAYLWRSPTIWFATAPILCITVHLALGPKFKNTYDMAPLANIASTWEKNGFAIAYSGAYHGQLQFIGKLENPIHEIQSKNELKDFYNKYPNGKLIKISKKENLSGKVNALPHGTRWAEIYEEARAE